MEIIRKTNKSVYTKRIVAFVDILGFSSLVEESRADTTLRRKISSAMKLIQKTVNEGVDSNVRQVSTFSDSAVISYDAEEHSSLFFLLLDIIHLQLALGARGIMIRGGISYGDCYHQGGIVFGPAMNEAYRLEHTVAKWPRVVIEKDVLEKAIDISVDHGTYSFQYEVDDVYDCLQIDEEGSGYKTNTIFFVDYLRQPQELVDYGDEYLEWLRQYRVAIVDGLNRYAPKSEYRDIKSSEKRRIFEKYRYVLKYWNSVVGDDDAPMPVPRIEKENQMIFREMYKKLLISKRYPYR